MRFLNSLRARLAVFLLLSAILTAAVIGFMTYRQTLEQNMRLIDYQLRQTAITLRDQGMVEDWQPDLLADEPNSVVVQIWTINGSILYVSHPGVALPARAVMGFANVEANGQQWRVYSMIARNRIIQVAQPYHIRSDLAADAALRSLRPLLAFAPVMAWLIWLVIGRALVPLKRLENEVRTRDARSLEPVSEQGLPSEIAPVAHALNSLLDRLQRAFSGQRAFVADAAHELRSPLTALKLQLRLLATAQDESEKQSAMRSLNEGVDRASRLIEQLLTAARTEFSESGFREEKVDLAETMRRVIVEVFPLAQSRRIDIGMDAPDHVWLLGDGEQLFILIRNLVDNAVRYTPEGGAVQARITADDGGICLTIDDSGSGIPAEDRERVFRRFYRRQSDNQDGNGLGLAIVKNIVLRHHGSIRLEDSPLGGLRACVCFDSSGGVPLAIN